MTMSESKKKRNKGEKGKRIPPLNSDVKGVIKSFIPYEDDDCVHLSILIRRRQTLINRYEVHVFMGNKRPVYNKKNETDQLIELNSGALMEQKGQLIFNENQTVSTPVFRRVTSVVRGAISDVLLSFTRNVTLSQYRRLGLGLGLGLWESVTGFEFTGPAFKTPALENAIKSAMDRYSESGNNVIKLYETRILHADGDQIQLFYKICKSQPRGVGLMKLALRKRKKGKGKKRPRTEEGAGAGGPSTSTPQLLLKY